MGQWLLLIKKIIVISNQIIINHFYKWKNKSNQILLVTIDCNPKITIICTYAPAEQASTPDKDTFYNNLTGCICDVPFDNFKILLGDFNARIGPSNAHLKTIGRYPCNKETNGNGNRLTDLCEANNICITTTRKQDPNRHKSYPQDIEILV